MLRVFCQLTPEPTGQSTSKRDRRTGETTEIKWHRARLIEVGYAQTWEEAKRLTPWPVVEEVTDQLH
jgi:hypothetical protein